MKKYIHYFATAAPPAALATVATPAAPSAGFFGFLNPTPPKKAAVVPVPAPTPVPVEVVKPGNLNLYTDFTSSLEDLYAYMNMCMSVIKETVYFSFSGAIHPFASLRR